MSKIIDFPTKQKFELEDLDCEYEGCDNTWIGWEPRFGYRYCEEHKKVPPAKWKHKDGYQ